MHLVTVLSLTQNVIKLIVIVIPFLYNNPYSFRPIIIIIKDN